MGCLKNLLLPLNSTTIITIDCRCLFLKILKCNSKTKGFKKFWRNFKVFILNVWHFKKCLNQQFWHKNIFYQYPLQFHRRLPLNSTTIITIDCVCHTVDNDALFHHHCNLPDNGNQMVSHESVSTAAALQAAYAARDSIYPIFVSLEFCRE